MGRKGQYIQKKCTLLCKILCQKEMAKQNFFLSEFGGKIKRKPAKIQNYYNQII